MTKLPLAVLALLLATTPALAKEHKDHKHKGKPEASSSLTMNSGSARFTTDDLNVVFTWTRNNPDARPLYVGLPPGIAKKLARGGKLPPGLAMRHLPYSLNAALGPAPAGYERITIGNDLLLVEISTQTIRDIIRGVLR
jgi:hypothetical protein